jgi:ElaB/YqjD/DUF883 family membrane-anchored ribosome-binding protein
MRQDDGQAVEDKAEAAARSELTHMISDLNEVHMKLDALLTRMSDPSMPVTHDSNLDTVRRTLDQQLTRIREKLSARLA